jgi:hypothetical protein
MHATNTHWDTDAQITAPSRVKRAVLELADAVAHSEAYAEEARLHSPGDLLPVRSFTYLWSASSKLTVLVERVFAKSLPLGRCVPMGQANASTCGALVEIEPGVCVAGALATVVLTNPQP